MGFKERYSNLITLSSYGAKLKEYIAGSPQEVDGGLKKFMDEAFAGVQPGATVLELGSGFGRDALYLQEQGFAVIPTDATASFVDELQRRGLPAYRLNILTDDFPKVDVIFANAVFLHLKREEFRAVLLKARAALNHGGKLIFTVKKGAGEEWFTDKLGASRFFVYWDFEDLIPELIRAGFTDVAAGEDSAGPVSWIQVVAS